MKYFIFSHELPGGSWVGGIALEAAPPGIFSGIPIPGASEGAVKNALIAHFRSNASYQIGDELYDKDRRTIVVMK